LPSCHAGVSSARDSTAWPGPRALTAVSAFPSVPWQPSTCRHMALLKVGALHNTFQLLHRVIVARRPRSSKSNQSQTLATAPSILQACVENFWFVTRTGCAGQTPIPSARVVTTLTSGQRGMATEAEQGAVPGPAMPINEPNFQFCLHRGSDHSRAKAFLLSSCSWTRSARISN
jgi:hypothetical protein